MRLIDAFRAIGLYVGSVVITQYAGQHAADLFQRKLEALGVKVYRHYPIADYPSEHRPHRLRRRLRQKRVHRDHAAPSSS